MEGPGVGKQRSNPDKFDRRVITEGPGLVEILLVSRIKKSRLKACEIATCGGTNCMFSLHFSETLAIAIWERKYY